jgi:hypothetical protein
MSSNASSVAAGELPRHETQANESDAALKAFNELYDMTEEETAVDPSPFQTKDHTMDDGIEEEDVFLLPESQNFVPGTAEDFTEKMRFNGLRWRQEESEERPHSQRIPPMGTQSSLTNGRANSPTWANAT